MVAGVAVVGASPAHAGVGTSYVDATGAAHTTTTAATTLTSATAALSDGWYLCTGPISYSAGLVVSGAVDLILGDDCALTATGTAAAGVQVAGTTSLTIWSQTTAGTGTLTATGGSRGAGIGGSAGSGGGTVTIHGGTVTATGDDYAAGIGGGYAVSPFGPVATGGVVTIDGGTVQATGGRGGAGIGGAASGDGAVVTVGGSAVVRATGGDYLAGIGSAGAGIGSGRGTGTAMDPGALHLNEQSNDAAAVLAQGGAGSGRFGAGADVGQGGYLDAAGAATADTSRVDVSVGGRGTVSVPCLSDPSGTCGIGGTDPAGSVTGSIDHVVDGSQLTFRLSPAADVTTFRDGGHGLNLNADGIYTVGIGGDHTVEVYFTHPTTAQTVSFTSSAPTGAAVGGSYSPTVTGGASGNEVVLSLGAATTNDACRISSGVVSFKHAGECVIDADQAGNDSYSAGSAVQQFAVGKGAQTITFADPSSAPAGTSSTPAASSTSALAVALSIDAVTADGVCRAASDGTVSFEHVGTCVIDANQAGDADYLAADQVQQSVTVEQAGQTVSFTSSAPSDAAVGGSYTPTASSTAGLPVGFSVAAPSTACSISAGTVSFEHAGTCVIDADQAGDADHAAAETATQRVTVGKASQTIALDLPAAAVAGDSYPLTARGGDSASPVRFSIDASTTSAACSIGADGSVSFDNEGTCVIDADQDGDADYQAAAQVQGTIDVAAAHVPPPSTTEPTPTQGPTREPAQGPTQEPTQAPVTSSVSKPAPAARGRDAATVVTGAKPHTVITVNRVRAVKVRHATVDASGSARVRLPAARAGKRLVVVYTDRRGVTHTKQTGRSRSVVVRKAEPGSRVFVTRHWITRVIKTVAAHADGSPVQVGLPTKRLHAGRHGFVVSYTDRAGTRHSTRVRVKVARTSPKGTSRG